MRSVTTVCERALALAVVLTTAACEVATGGAFASSGVTFGASVGEAAEDETSSTSDDGVGKTDDGPLEGPEPGVEETSTSSDDDTSTGDDTSTSDTTTSLPEESESEAESESESGEPAVEPWSSCLGGGCGADMVCMSEPMQPGVCTQACLPADDASSCPPAPDGLDTTCVIVEGTSWCAIDCSFDECPAETACYVVAQDHVVKKICL